MMAVRCYLAFEDALQSRLECRCVQYSGCFSIQDKLEADLKEKDACIHQLKKDIRAVEVAAKDAEVCHHTVHCL